MYPRGTFTAAAAKNEAKALAGLVERREMTAAEVIELCEVRPQDAELAAEMGLDGLLRRSQAFRRRVLRDFEKLNGQR